MKAPVPEPTQKPSETLQALEASAGARTTSARGLAFVLLLLLAGFALSAWQMWLLQNEQKAQSQRTQHCIHGLRQKLKRNLMCTQAHMQMLG